MATTRTAHSRDLSLRHAVATLAYRGAKVIRDAPPGFSELRPGPTSRSAGQILAHVNDLLDWVLTQARGKEKWHTSKPRSWEEDSERFFTRLRALDEYLASDASLHQPADRIFQGGIADALAHVGQIAMLRRLAGARVRGENYNRAKIEAGSVGPDQRKAVREFGK